MSDNKVISDKFKNNIKEWVSIDDQIRDLQKQIKLFKQVKKEKEEFILEYLTNINENQIQISDGKLIKNVSKTKAPLKNEMITDTLIEVLKDDKEAFKITEMIMLKRPMTERINLKRTHNHKK
jgi:precorrin-3B methylase